MGVESASYIKELDKDQPQGNESISEGDNHIRVIKTALVKSFPEVDGPVDWTPGDFQRIKDYVDNPAQAASCKWNGTSLGYSHNVASVTGAGDQLDNLLGVRITFDNLIPGFDSHYAVSIQPMSTNGRHVVATILTMQSTYVEFTVIEFDGSQWVQPAGGAPSIGFTFLMVDTSQ